MREFHLIGRFLVLSFVVSLLAGCGSIAHQPLSSGVGPHPELARPERSFIPTVNVVTAIGWAPDETPVAAEGMEMVAFARGWRHPRWLHVVADIRSLFLGQLSSPFAIWEVGLESRSAVLADQVRTIAREGLVRRSGAVSRTTPQRVEEVVRFLLGL